MVWSHSYFPFHVLVVLLLNMEGAIKLKFCQTARLVVCYGMVSFFAKVKIFRFRPKTMDYNPWLDFRSTKKVLRKACQLKEHEKRNQMMLVSAA